MLLVVLLLLYRKTAQLVISPSCSLSFYSTICNCSVKIFWKKWNWVCNQFFCYMHYFLLVWICDMLFTLADWVFCSYKRLCSFDTFFLLFVKTQLWNLAQRTTSLPLGRGAFTLATIHTLLTEVLLYLIFFILFCFHWEFLHFLLSKLVFLIIFFLQII